MGKYSAPKTPQEVKGEKGFEIKTPATNKKGETKILFEQELRELMVLTQQSKRR